MDKPKIKVLIADGSSANLEVEFLKTKYDIEVIKDSTLASPDLIVFTGGEDVHPSLYDENVGKHTYCNTDRDVKERDVFKRYPFVPKLGICRGAQLLTVLNDGKLIQHVSGHNSNFDTIYSPSRNMRIKLTSDHHQMMYPFNLDESRYEILYHSEFYLSDTYLNGDNQEIELPSNFIEPEIVWYPTRKSLCIQGHPEWAGNDSKSIQEIFYLIDTYLQVKSSPNISTLHTSFYDNLSFSLGSDLSDTITNEISEESND